MRRKHPSMLLILGLLSLTSLIYLAIYQSPTANFPFSIFHFPFIYVFFLLIFLFIYSIFSYLFISTKQGLLFGLFATVYLFLRFIHLTHPLFLIILIALFISLELSLKKGPKLLK
ncbi:MAG: hypothetical protein Q7R31_01745 [Candidatus Levybacteria bacterium]|nr:hypothetical protein [Candidatus Levybacteria bacterium]